VNDAKNILNKCSLETNDPHTTRARILENVRAVNRRNRAGGESIEQCEIAENQTTLARPTLPSWFLKPETAPLVPIHTRSSAKSSLAERVYIEALKDLIRTEIVITKVSSTSSVSGKSFVLPIVDRICRMNTNAFDRKKNFCTHSGILNLKPYLQKEALAYEASLNDTEKLRQLLLKGHPKINDFSKKNRKPNFFPEKLVTEVLGDYRQAISQSAGYLNRAFSTATDDSLAFEQYVDSSGD